MNFNFYGHEFSYVRCALGISAFRILDQAYFAGSYHEIYGKYGNAYQSESTNQAEQIVAVILNIYHLLSIASFILLIYGAVALNAGCLKAWLHLAGFGVVTQYVLYIVLAVLTGKSIFELESLFTIIVLWTLAVLFLVCNVASLCVIYNFYLVLKQRRGYYVLNQEEYLEGEPIMVY